jgi:preprotein translocase subunit YajC
MLDFLTAAAGSAGTGPGWIAFVPYIGIFAIIYFLMIRPLLRQQKTHREKIAAVKKGDQVVTGGGVVGKVVRVDDTYADVEIAQGVKIKVVKSTIGDIVPPAGKPAND